MIQRLAFMLYSPRMIEDALPAADALSGALMTMKLEAFRNVALDAGGCWAIDFPAYEGLTFNIVQRGDCWLTVEGADGPLRVVAGDCFLMTGKKPFTLSSDAAPMEAIRAEALFPFAPDGVVRCNDGEEVHIVGTIFRFQGHLPAIMFGQLPAAIHIAGGSDAAAVLRWTQERFATEFRGSDIGRTLILAHLAPMMLLQALRVYQLAAPGDENWLTALSDKRLARAIEAMQGEWARPWSLATLAAVAGMSRSGFAVVFRRKTGIAPMDYLMNWRMQMARDLLISSSDSLVDIAAQVGYGSESAFSAAFTKVVTCRPGAYRTRASTSRR